MKKILFCTLLVFLSRIFSATGQQRIIAGSAINATTKMGIPFVSISLKKQLIGTVSNENGLFELHIPKDSLNDTLVVNAMGFKPQFFALESISLPLTVQLEPDAFELNEVVIRAMPPTYYIQLAMKKTKENFPDHPFQTEAYYREKVKENNQFVRCNEGIFRTYYPNIKDTIHNQHQLLLYRQPTEIHAVEFMAKENKKAEAKAIRKGKKPDESHSAEMDIQKMFGGPESILKSADLIHSPSPFLDSVNFHNYNYTFAKSSTYNNHELMAIRFDSRGKVDHVREEGIIYIDMRTNAIVKIESSGDLIIPILIRPVIFMMGFGIENPTFSATQEYTQVNGSWYPKNFQVNLDLNVTRKHWFDANEHSDFQIEAIFTVNKIKPDVHDQIPVANRFDSKKEMSTQVHSEPGINWDGVNIIKP